MNFAISWPLEACYFLGMATASVAPLRDAIPSLSKILRKVAERTVRGMVIRRKLPNGTRFFVTPEAQLKYLWSAFDPELVALGKQHSTPESVVWDIGANCGVLAFSCAGARRILAVEPDPFLAGLIDRSADKAGMPEIDIITAAVSNRIGFANFTIAARGRASNHLAEFGTSQAGGGRDESRVVTVTLDSLLETHAAPTFVKIDVEGAELMALEGAHRLLREVRPIIYAELGGKARAACLALLKEAGYTATRTNRGANFLCIPD